MIVGSYKIENNTDADERLTALFADEKITSMDRFYMEADKYIKDDSIREYFLTRAKEWLKARGYKVA